METLLIMLLWTVPPLADRIEDPAPGFWPGKQEARNLECTRMPQPRAHELYPGKVPEASARVSTLVHIDALVCERRYIRYGERNARDEVILSALRKHVGEIADVAVASSKEALTWHVDAFYPEPRVASKIAVAARTDLAERGLKVSDRVPLLAAGDLAVLRDLPPEQAYPVACRRYFDQQSLGESDALLAIVLLDARETLLHAGVCRGGAWRWVR